MVPAKLSNETIRSLLFTKQDDGDSACNTCNKTYRSPSALLPQKNGLALDGWSDSGHRCIAIFAVFDDHSAGVSTGVNTGSIGFNSGCLGSKSRPADDHLYDDLDCHTRAQSMFDLMADTLSHYREPRDAVSFIVGDNCSVTQSIWRRVGEVPMEEYASMAGLAHYRSESNFAVGDFVLWSRVDARLGGNKLMVRWARPFQVVDALPHQFVARNLLENTRR
ncbi:hypothetical protein FI667_g4297, partial [Globisporangium splendens]